MRHFGRLLVLGKIKHQGVSLFEQPLAEVLNSKKPLYRLANKIDWDFIEENLSPFYSKNGRPSHPVRLMAGLLILKNLRNLSDEILVDEKGKILKRAWLWKIKYNLPTVEIVRKLNKAGLKISERKSSQTFRNPFYCGKVVCSFIPNEVHEGMHQRMVSPEQFFKVIEILKGRFEKSKHSVVTNQQLPLKRFATCGDCGQPTTGYHKKQKNLYYYKCRTKGCKRNVSQKKLHQDFQDLLTRYEIKPSAAGHIEKTLKYVFKLYNQDVDRGLTDYRSNLTKIATKLERLEERYVDEEISKELFNKHHARLNQEKEEIEALIENSMIKSSNLERCVEWTVEISTKLNALWTFEDFENSERLQKSGVSRGNYL